MANSRMIKPASAELIPLAVLRSTRLAPHWVRVTFGGGEIDRFTPMGYDQWLRVFLPVGGEAALNRVPAKTNHALGYLKFLRIPDGERPVMRNYSVRAFRPAAGRAGAELDVDVVLHGSAAEGTAGPASRWAETCRPGEHVLVIDEGLTFNPARGTERVVLVGDETALPAIASTCASLPGDAAGSVLLEAPTAEDALDFPHPAGVDVRWFIRTTGDRPGVLALAALRELTLPEAPFHAYAAGEQALASGARKLLVGERGVDKGQVSFCGYWRIGSSSPASRAAREAAATPVG